MSTLFPNSIQDLDATRGSASDTLSTVNHVTHHQTEDDTIEALQAKVGVNNSAVTSSLDYKVSSTSSINPGHMHTLDNLSDVSTSGAVNGDFLSFNGSTWAPTTTSAPDASTTVKGVAKMSVAPASASSPIAVGDNDPRVPTTGENDALVGTSGTPSSSNKYVTNDDTSATSSASKVARMDANGKIAESITYFDYQLFTSNGTWTKPTGLTGNEVVLVQAWGAGGGGGTATSSGSNTSAGGGGGGSMVEHKFRASDLSSTVAVTIGTGGAAATAGTNTTFGSYLTAYGGGAGASATNGLNYAGGGGAGIAAVGADASTTTPGIGGGYAGGAATVDSSFGGGGGSAVNQNAGSSVYGGGGGGGGAASGSYSAGSSIYGGGGGAGGAYGGTSTAGGSKFGGAGGTAGNNTNGGGGTAPAGGGGGGGRTSTGTSTGGSGARGEMRIWVLI